jgi:hypothetical protein
MVGPPVRPVKKAMRTDLKILYYNIHPLEAVRSYFSVTSMLIFLMRTKWLDFQPVFGYPSGLQASDIGSRALDEGFRIWMDRSGNLDAVFSRRPAAEISRMTAREGEMAPRERWMGGRNPGWPRGKAGYPSGRVKNRPGKQPGRSGTQDSRPGRLKNRRGTQKSRRDDENGGREEKKGVGELQTGRGSPTSRFFDKRSARFRRQWER